MEIELTSKAERQWDRLQKNPIVFSKIELALDEIADNPLVGKLLSGKLAGIRSYRVGDWRILYCVELHRLIIYIISIANRKEVYR